MSGRHVASLPAGSQFSNNTLTITRYAGLTYAALATVCLKRMAAGAIAIRALHRVLDDGDFPRATAGDTTEAIRSVGLCAGSLAKGTLCHAQPPGFFELFCLLTGDNSLPIALEATLPYKPVAPGSSHYLMAGSIAVRTFHRIPGFYNYTRAVARQTMKTVRGVGLHASSLAECTRDSRLLYSDLPAPPADLTIRQSGKHTETIFACTSAESALNRATHHFRLGSDYGFRGSLSLRLL